MNEIDLVPGHYRRLQRVRSTLHRLALAVALVAVLAGGARAGLRYAIETEQGELSRLRTVRSGLLSQKARIQQLELERGGLERELAILEQLRGGVAARETLLAVDRALNGNVWFQSWAFRRAGEWSEEEPESTQTGYFIVVPPEARDGTERAWRLDSHMEIHAQAADHSALAAFVRALVEQPEVSDVRVVSTRVHRYTSGQVVSFELAVVLRNRA